MITEREFSVVYTSLWRDIIPSADNFIRHVNSAAQRFVAPYHSVSAPALNGAINETAFRMCRLAWERSGQNFRANSREARKVWIEVCLWLGQAPVGRYSYSSDIWLDVRHIASNMYSFLALNVVDKVVFEPKFPGCGVIAQCSGDAVLDGVLLEVKAGDRGFRATDLRQLFVYCALARVAGLPPIKSIKLMNPRWGVSWESSVENAATSCGALSSAELLDEIVRCAVLLGVSK